MHHSRVDFANPGDNVGLNIKGLDKGNMPRSGDVMVYKKDTTLGQTSEFDAQIQVLDIPNEIKMGVASLLLLRRDVFLDPLGIPRGFLRGCILVSGVYDL